MTGRERYTQAMRDAVAAAEQLAADGHEDRAAGLAVAVDIGTSAAFLFSLGERDFDNAANVVREAIAHATRRSP